MNLKAKYKDSSTFYFFILHPSSLIPVAAIVFFPVNFAAVSIFHTIEPDAFAPRDDAVGFRTPFVTIYPSRAATDAVGFAPRQLARSDALPDAVFLIALAFVHARRSLSENVGGKNAEKSGDY